MSVVWFLIAGQVLEVWIRRCWSVWSHEAKACGCLAAKRAAIAGTASVRELPIAAGRAQLSERLSVPLRPMIGVIATASSDPSAASTFEPTFVVLFCFRVVSSDSAQVLQRRQHGSAAAGAGSRHRAAGAG
jgi:hypothetical protein